MLIKVLQRHIEMGKHSSACYCPVALAICETLNIAEVGVYPNYCKLLIRISKSMHDYTIRVIKLPEEVNTFICDYDSYKAVEPMEFELPC